MGVEDRFPYPRELVVGVVRTTEDVDRALASLQDAGFASDAAQVLHGEDDARSLDVSGDAHGFRGQVIRTLQAAVSSDLDHVRRHAEHMRAGDYVVAVAVGEDDDAKRRAADALHAADAHFVNYYGNNYIESLDVERP